MEENKLEQNKTVSINELDEFYDQMCEDWHLWDEREQGQYPIKRVLDAMNNFINFHKSKNKD
jgi:hypothetical protein